MSELDLSYEDTEEAYAQEEIDPLTLIQESLEDFPPLLVDNEEDDIDDNDTLTQAPSAPRVQIFLLVHPASQT